MRLSKIGLVGFIIVGAIFGFLAISIFTGEFAYWGAKNIYYICFDDVRGLKVGDEVRYSGLQIGKVLKITIVNDEKFAELKAQARKHNIPEDKLAPLFGKAIVKIACDQKMKFYKSWTIFIEQTTLLGGRHISIERKLDVKEVGLEYEPGRGEYEFAPLPGARRVVSLERLGEWLEEKTASIDELISSLTSLASDLKNAQGSFYKFIHDPKLYNEATDFFANANKLTQDLQPFASDLSQGKGTLSKLIREDELYNKLNSFADKITNILDMIDKGEGTFGMLIKDKDTADNVKNTLAELRNVVESISSSKGTLGLLVNERKAYDEILKTIENINEVFSKLSTQEGALSKLIYDVEMGNDLKAAISDIKTAAESLKNITGKVERGEGALGKLVSEDTLYEEAKETLGTVKETLGETTKMKVMAGLQTKSYSESDASISKFYVRIYPGKENRFFQLGAALMDLDKDGDVRFEDQFEKDEDQTFLKPDVQLGYKFLDNLLTLRAGVIEGKIGAGIDYDLFVPPINQDVRLTFESRKAYSDFEDEDIDEGAGSYMHRLEVSTKIFKYFRVYAGVSRLFEDEEFMAGISFEYEDEDIKKMLGLFTIGATR